MMRKLPFLLSLLLTLPALAQQRPAPIQYGVPTTVTWWFFNDDGRVDTDEADDGAGDSECTISKDHAAPGAIAAQYAYDSDSKVYRLALTATEATFGQASIICPQAGETNEIIELTTFGDLNAFDKTKGMASGTAQSGTNTPPQIVLAAATSIADDRLIGKPLCITGGTGAGQCGRIADWASSSDTATVSTEYTDNAWLTAPDSTSQYIVLPGTQGLQACDASGRCDVNVVEQNGSATAANNAKLHFDGTGYDAVNSTIGTLDQVTSDAATLARKNINLLIGTCASGSTTTCTDALLTHADSSQIDDRLVCFEDDWCALITGFTPGTDTFTTTKVAPSTRSGLDYTIFPSTLQ